MTRFLISATVIFVAEVSSARTVDQVLAEAIRANYAGLHACYRRALAVDRRRSGSVFVRLVFAADGSVHKARVLRDEIALGKVGSCLTKQVMGWRLGADARRAGLTAEAEVVLPLTFEAHPQQSCVALQDVPESDLPPGLHARRVRFRRYLTEANAGTVNLTLSVVDLAGELRVSSTFPACDLVVLKGRLRTGIGSLSLGQALRRPHGQALTLHGDAQMLLVERKKKVSGKMRRLYLRRRGSPKQGQSIYSLDLRRSQRSAFAGANVAVLLKGALTDGHGVTVSAPSACHRPPHGFKLRATAASRMLAIADTP